MRLAGAHPRLWLLAPAFAVAAGAARAQQPVVTDALYKAHHPRLLFNSTGVPALRAKLVDGGLDDNTFAFAQHVVHDNYPGFTPAEILGPWYGEDAIPLIGLVAHLETPPDSVAKAMGRTVTKYIADTYNADADEANSGMRLRALALGYDLFYEDATPAERGYIRDEIVLYVQKMIWNTSYRVFEQPPYLSNHSAMFGAALGLAAIALAGEAEAYLSVDAMAMADRVVASLLGNQFDPAGSYHEGGFYALWTLKNLVYYFDARRRFDGQDLGAAAPVRAAEQWLAYELLPEGAGRSHNLNDSPTETAPFEFAPTYFNWAMSEWGSGLSAWLWEHTAGAVGPEFANDTDRVGAILWQRPVLPVDPASVLPQSRIWLQRGLYCFRTGWQLGPGSQDVLFSFYSGKFQGGHAQEDQNQFALYAYGQRFAVDHGPGNLAKESEAHNMVFIDGKGQHNAGSSIGTDGRIAAYLLGGFADYVVGDATDAYTTYSPYNAPNFPVGGTDWSWGYSGANPVEQALRRVVVVHGRTIAPYFVVMDDIDKDGTTHSYEWRMHTASTNTVNASANPIIISGAAGTMNVHLINPPLGAVSITTEPFDNLNIDPNSTLLRVATTAVRPAFAFLLLPRRNTTSPPGVTPQTFPWGYGFSISWGGGFSDHFIRNDSGLPVDYGNIATDALVTLVRKHGASVEGYFAADLRSLEVGNTAYATITDGPATCELWGASIHIDRYDADFRFFNSGIDEVLYRTQRLGFLTSNGYVVPDPSTGVGDPPVRNALALSARPNPFNAGTTIRIGGDVARARVVVYDVAGRRVRLLWDGPLAAPSQSLAWDGCNDDGEPVASGTYFLKAFTPAGVRALKLTVLK